MENHRECSICGYTEPEGAEVTVVRRGGSMMCGSCWGIRKARLIGQVTENAGSEAGAKYERPSADVGTVRPEDDEPAPAPAQGVSVKKIKNGSYVIVKKLVP